MAENCVVFPSRRKSSTTTEKFARSTSSALHFHFFRSLFAVTSMSSPSSSSGRLYLDCPFEEKEDAKSLGARWDAKTKQWYVPEGAPAVSIFHRWLPRAYLDCTYDDKDQVKGLGAKWDASARRWFVPEGFSLNKFKKWIHQQSTSPSNQKNGPLGIAKAPPASGARKKNTTAATLPRVTGDMTVAQLKDECLARDPSVTGLSGKSKSWLLDHLQVGSVWIHQQQQATASTPAAAAAANIDATTSAKKRKVPLSSPQKKQKMASSSSKARSSSGSTNKTKKAKTSTPSSVRNERAAIALSSVDLAALPRVSDKLNRSQLTRELLHRKPDATGLSNKNKDWFLAQLGTESIWATAPECQFLVASAAAALETVSTSMTLDQLIAECLARSPTAKGLSGKSKAWFIQYLGEGSIRMSAPFAAAPTSKKPTASKVSTSTMTASSSSSKKAPSNKARSAAKAAPENKNAIKAEKIASMSTKTDSASGSSKPTKNSAVARKPPPRQGLATKAARRTGQIVAQPLAVASNPNHDPVLFYPPLVKSAETHSTIASSARTTGCGGTTKPTQKKVKEVLLTTEGLPAVSAKMTVAQLKEEIKFRQPDIRGLSKMNAAALVSHLGSGTAWESHADTCQARKREAESLHSIQSQAHSHPLADSSKLRCPPHRGTLRNRAAFATCDCPRTFASWCRRTAYRTCEKCDFDLCQACFEIESMDEAKKEEELDKRYRKMAEENLA